MQITQQVGESRREGWVASLTSYLHISLLEAIRLLPAITNFLSLSNEILMIVSTDIPHHASLPGSTDRLTLHQCSPDSPVP